MPDRITIRIKANQARFVYNDLTAEGMGRIAARSVTRRASHVEPDGENWTADMAPEGGPVLGPFPTRNEALSAERDWLHEHRGL